MHSLHRLLPKRYFSTLFSLLITSCVLAQEGKAFFKSGQSLFEKGKFQAAIEQLDLAIKVSPDYAQAFDLRGEVKQRLGDIDGSLDDRRTAAELAPKKSEFAVRSAQAYLDQGYLNDAQEMCNLALLQDRKNLQVLRVKVLASLTQGNIDGALDAANRGLEVKKTTDTYFYHGLASYAARDYETALTDFEEVIDMNYLYEAAYIGQSQSLLKVAEEYSGETMRKRAWEKVIRQSTLAIDLNPESKDALIVRSKAYALMKDHALAINDVSKVVALDLADAEVYWLRAQYYKDFGQYQNAINDLNRVLADRDEDIEAYVMRAECHSSNLNGNKALADLEKASGLIHEQGLNSEKVDQRIAEEHSKIFEKNREQDAPFIRLNSPTLVNRKAQVSGALNELLIVGEVDDQSLIEMLSVNEIEVPGSASTRRSFELSLPVRSDSSEYVIIARDVYGNEGKMQFLIERTEQEAPELIVASGNSFKNGRFQVYEDKANVLMSLSVLDDSPIRNLQINGIPVKFESGAKEVRVTEKVDLIGVRSVVVLAEDIHGNIGKAEFPVVKKARPVVAKKAPSGNDKNTVASSSKASKGSGNELGVTWVIFIDNSNYKEFPSINSSDAELAKMKKAFASYRVHNTLRKRNMSKSQMDAFFKTELRDLVRRNKVNAVLIWYSGHGEYQGNKHYWVPVDAKKDNSYTYFDATRLKASVKAFSTSMRHTMVVADAVGNDPSFYEMTR